jgi:Amt family ammonium transporter
MSVHDVFSQIAQLTAHVAELEARSLEHDAELSNLRRLQETVWDDAALDRRFEGIDSAMTHSWIILASALIMFMQAGFAMLEAGCCRTGFVSSVLEKNLLDACIAAMAWWMLGWGFAYGDVPQYGFIGREQFFSIGFIEQDSVTSVITPNDMNLNWYFQLTFSATSTTIISGAMAERLYLSGYVFFCFAMCSFIYPVVVAWTWSCSGWLNYVGAGYMDFAGSGIVHMCGGVGGLCGTYIMGPRKGRFDEGVDQSQFEAHNVVYVVLGTIILWFGWYGFNCGSTLTMNETAGYLAAQVAVNTTLAPAMSGLVVTFWQRLQTGRWNVCNMCGGCLGGLVSITASCGNVMSWSAIVVGFIGGIVYMNANNLLLRFHIDDPVQAFPVHGACGMWGLIGTALFDWGGPNGKYHGWGGYSPTDGATIGGALAAQVVGLLAIAGWSGIILGCFFQGMKKIGFLRVSEECEDLGLDAKEFSPARPYSNPHEDPYMSPKPSAAGGGNKADDAVFM